MLRLNSSLRARFLVLPVAAGRSVWAGPNLFHSTHRDIFQRLSLDGYSDRIPGGKDASGRAGSDL
jgi:hypothetical protein